MSALDRQEGGAHYKKYAIEPVEFCHRNNLSWCQANVVKYVVRFRDKGGRADLAKARHYLDMLEEFEYGKAEEKTISEEAQPNITGLLRQFVQTEGAAGQTPHMSPGYGQLGT